MKIEIPVKVFRVAGKYYVATYQKSGGYAIIDMNGSPFPSEAAAKNAVLGIIEYTLEDLKRPKLIPEAKKILRGRKKK